ncbi:M-phase phosphoprotein 8 [Entomophthora muscae]|uniref:M-phase phosphoprotein 8 n=1 Tax=Entomophthora muscae TaxID=34485 RepID=A0ACC2SM27_9FUNG|nr:M-phase phosphoprotein 8 [Entomophthora muscae]
MITCFPTNGSNSLPPYIQTGLSEECESKYIHDNITHYQNPQYYVKWKGYLIEESTWEPLSNLSNAQEAVQLYLNKKNRKGGLLGEEGDGVRIGNSFSLETQDQDWDSNPDPESPQAAGPMDQGATCPRFPEVKLPQAEAKNDGPKGKASQAKGISAPNGGVIKASNGGNEIPTISFISFKSKLVTNHEPSPERSTGLQPNPMTTTLEQDNQVSNLRSLTNEKNPSPGAILLPLNQNPQACLSQCPDEPPMENIKFGSGVLYRPKDPML